MIYKPNTAFMDLYEALSRLNEDYPDLYSQSTVDADTVSKIVQEQQAIFAQACSDVNNTRGINNLVTAHSTFLCMPDQLIDGVAVNVVHTNLTAGGYAWRALDDCGMNIKNEIPALAASGTKDRPLPDCRFDLSKSWLFFNVSGRYLDQNVRKYNKYSEEDAYFEILERLPVDADSAKQVKFNQSNAIAKTVVHFKANFSIGIPFGQYAGDEISLAFSQKVKDSDTVAAARQKSHKRMDLEQENKKAINAFCNTSYSQWKQNRIRKAISFVKDFISKNYRCTLPSGYTVNSLLNESDIRNIAFHTEDLVAYARSSEHDRDGLLALLSIFNVKLHTTYKSVQYLYNAHKQEDLLINYDTGYLVRNNAATKLPEKFDVPDNELYKYLVPGHCVTEAPDFKYALDQNILVDAKIYADACSAIEHSNPSDKSTHNAHFLIAYLKHPVSLDTRNTEKEKRQKNIIATKELHIAGSTHWVLIDLERDSADTGRAKLKLSGLIYKLNKNNITLDLVEPKDFR